MINFFLNLDFFNFFITLDRFFIIIPEILVFCIIVFMLIINFFSNSNYSNNLLNKFCSFSLLLIIIFMISFNFLGLDFSYLSKDILYYYYIKIIIIGCSIIVFLFFELENSIKKTFRFKFYLLCMLSLLGMLNLISCNNLISFYISIELQLIPIYILCSTNISNIKLHERSNDLFIIVLSSIVILLGIILIYAYSSYVRFDDIKLLLNSKISNQILISIVILLSGIVLKIYSTSSYSSFSNLIETTPIPIILFIGTSSFSAFVGAILLFTFNFMEEYLLIWNRSFLFLSIFLILTGALGVFIQKNIKRFLGYFSILSAGYFLLAIYLNSHNGFESVLLYLINYVFLLFGFFVIIILLKKDGEFIINVSDLSGLSSSQPFFSLTLLVLLFSMCGIPPFLGFFSKWFILSSVLQMNNIYISFTVILSSLLVTFSCFKIIKIMYFNTSNFVFKIENNIKLKYIMFVSLIINSFIFLMMSPLIDLIINNK